MANEKEFSQQKALVHDPVVKKSLEIAASGMHQFAPIRFPEVDPAEILSCPDGAQKQIEQKTRASQVGASTHQVRKGLHPPELNIDFFKKRQALIQNLLDPVVTEEEVATLLCVDKDTVKCWEGEGKIVAFKKTATHLFFRLSTILSFLEKRKEEAGQEA